MQLCWFAAACLISTAAADTILGMVDFGSNNQRLLLPLPPQAVLVYCYWAVGASFRYSTSGVTRPYCRSHWQHLLFGGDFGAVNWGEGEGFELVCSSTIRFCCRLIIVKAINKLYVNVDRQRADEMFGHLRLLAQSICCGCMVHKMVSSCPRHACNCTFRRSWSCWCRCIPAWLQAILCAALMFIGTATAEERLLKSRNGNGKLERHQGFAASFGTASLLLSTLTGLSRFNNSYKNDRHDGCGCCKNIRSNIQALQQEMVAAWCLLSPGCGLIGFLLQNCS